MEGSFWSNLFRLRRTAQIALYPHFWHDDRIHKSAQIYINLSSLCRITGGSERSYVCTAIYSIFSLLPYPKSFADCFQASLRFGISFHPISFSLVIWFPSTFALTHYHYDVLKKIMKLFAHSGGKTERRRWGCPILSYPVNLDIERCSLESFVCPIVINLLDRQAQTPSWGFTASIAQRLHINYCRSRPGQVPIDPLKFSHPTYLLPWIQLPNFHKRGKVISLSDLRLVLQACDGISSRNSKETDLPSGLRGV